MYINMLSDYLKKTYGKKLYKMILSGGMTCPNRDGKCGDRGCIFCSSGGSGEFAQDSMIPIDVQIENEKNRLRSKTFDNEFIAYFQPFSNTYANIEYLRKLFTSVIVREDVAILSIATRPDCLNNEVLDLLSELNRIKPVWVELGLQTIHESTAQFIRRGYTLEVYNEAVINLHKIGINVITHIILGLPHETKKEMIETAGYVGKVSDGIKFHMLFVLKDTDLADIYTRDEFHILSCEEYTDALCDCIRNIPEKVVIHRLTGDPDKSSLISPLWTLDKTKVLREINNAFYDKNVVQGEYLRS